MPLVENRTAFVAVGIFIAVFTALFSLRLLLAPELKLPVGDGLWELDFAVTVNSNDKQQAIRVATPVDTEHARILSQKFTHPGMRMTRLKSRSEDSNDLVLRTLETGQLAFSAEYVIQTSTAHRWLTRQTHPIRDAAQRQRYLQAEEDIEVESEVVANTLSALSLGASDNDGLVNNIFQYLLNSTSSVVKAPHDNADYVLLHKRGSILGRANAMVALCRAARIPARTVTGLILSESLNAPLHYWVDVFFDNQWHSFDPVYGYAGELPPNFIPLKFSSDPPVYSDDDVEINTDITVSPAIGASRLIQSESARWLDVLDLTRLSVDMQGTLSTLLMLPFGALLTVFFRQILGLRAYGTFTPSLLALAVIHAEWITTLFILLSVAAFAVSGHALVRHHMSRVPRLTVIFTLVALSMGFAISAMDYLELAPAANVVLLPIIILTGLIDHLYRTVEQSGMRIAALRLCCTVIVGVVCYLLFQIEYLAHWILKFPETHLLTLAAAILMNLYGGKKLCQYPPLDWLTEAKHRKPSHTADNVHRHRQPVSLEP